MPPNNPALRRSLRALAHPATLVAVLALLLNDHLLRIYWPAWWTGKLGDFAWLAFFPLVLALPLSLLISARTKRQEAVVAGLAFGGTWLMFAAMKTIPAAMDAGLWLLRQFTGGPFILRPDPTDLLTLPALLIAGWVWRQTAQPASALRAWAVLALGAFASIATSAPAPVGLSYLAHGSSGEILAYNDGTGSWLSSTDGGLTWGGGPPYDPDAEFNFASPHKNGEPWQITDPADGAVRYRFTLDQAIERSADGGQTWHTEVDLRLSDAQAAYQRIEHSSMSPIRGPMDAVIDEARHTVVVTMGAQGIVTRTADGVWHWVSFGDPGSFSYVARASDLHNVPDTANLLTVELLLAADMFLLALTALWDMTPGRASSGWYEVGRFVTYGLWILFLLLSRSLSGSGLEPLYVPFLVVMLVFGMGYASNAFNELRKLGGGALGTAAKFAALAAGLFILPYLLWSQSILPLYWIAQVSGPILATGVLIYRTATMDRPTTAAQGGSPE